MITWGICVRNKIVKRGDFYCPNCQDYRIYNLVEPRRWGHISGLALIPLEELTIYVECNSCNNAYKVAVLQHDPIREEAEAKKNLIALVTQVMMMMADARGHCASMDRIAATIESFLGYQPSPDTIKSASAIVDREASLRNFGQLAAFLSSTDKERLLSAAIVGPILSDQERAVAVDIGRRLGLTEAHVRGILMNPQ
jgi:hypothetical protein